MDYTELGNTYGTQEYPVSRTGRFDAVTQSAGVNIMVVPDRASFDEASMAPADPQRYPAGQPSDHHIQKGELVFYMPSAQPHGSAMPGSAQFITFAALNGRHKNDDIHFLGVVAAGDKDTDTALSSVQISGSITISNVGSHGICAGQLVCWEFPPEMKHSNGVRLPLHKDSDEASMTRFLPVLRPFTPLSVAQRWTAAIKAINDGTSRDECVEKFGILREPHLRASDPVGRLYDLLRSNTCLVRRDGTASTASAEFADHATGFRLSVPVHMPTSRRTNDSNGKIAAAACLFADYMQLASARVIGRALSHSLPGQTMDLLINARS